MPQYPSAKTKITDSDFRHAFMLTKSDTDAVSADAANTLGVPFVNGIQAATTGNIVVKTASVGTGPAQATITITGAAVGDFFPIPVVQLMSTGTTATVIGYVR